MDNQSFLYARLALWQNIFETAYDTKRDVDVAAAAAHAAVTAFDIEFKDSIKETKE